MKVLQLAAIAAVGLVLTGCASVQRVASFSGPATAQIMVEGRRMNVWVHPREPSVMVAMTVGDAAGGGLIEGLTWGLARGFKPDPRNIDAALTQWLAPVGCRASPVVELGSDDANFEARYTCREGVDLRQLLTAQRAQLMTGAPIRVP